MQKIVRQLIPIAAAAIALSFPIFFVSAVPAQTTAEPKTVIAFGDSRIYNDLNSAKNAAISNGLSFAVQTVAADLVSESNLTAEFETISSLLIDKRNEFIKDYRIVRELRTEKHYRVLIQANILADRMQQELASAGIGDTAERLPTLMLMIAEKPINSLDYRYWWKKGDSLYPVESTGNPVISVLQQKGLVIVTPEELGADGYTGPDLGHTPSNYEAARVARQAGADLVVVGTARVEPSANRMGEDLRTMKAVVDVRVLRTDSGETLTTVREQAVAVGEDPGATADNALTDAANQTGQELASRILPLWSRAEIGSGKRMISVTGDNILPHLEKFRQTLQAIPGVSSLQTRQMTPDSATLEIQHKGTPQELADAILLQPYEQFGINITRISPDRLDIELLSEF